MDCNRRFKRDFAKRQRALTKRSDRSQQVAAMVAELGRRIAQEIHTNGGVRIADELMVTLKSAGVDMDAFAQQCGVVVSHVEADGELPAHWTLMRQWMALAG